MSEGKFDKESSCSNGSLNLFDNNNPGTPISTFKERRPVLFHAFQSGWIL